MFALGILAILHTLFLPGFLILRALGLTGTGALRTIILAAPISLLVNHMLIFGLTGAGVMHRWAVVGLMVAELVGVIFLWLRGAGSGGGAAGDIRRWREFIPAIAARRPWVALAGFAAVIAALWMLGVWGMRTIGAWGGIFTHWDAVVSWNRWAISWAEGRLPELTWFYPQILPTAYAATYIAIGTTDVQFFALAIASLFPLLMLLGAFELGLRLHDARCMAAIPPIGWLMWALLGYTSLAGYADAPVAALTLIAVCAPVAANAAGARERTGLLIAGALAAAAAALTKQAGWLIAGVYPLMAYAAVLHRTPSPLVRRVGSAFLLALLIAAMLAPWYIYRWLVPAGREFEYLLTGIHGERSYLERAARGVEHLASAGLPRWATLYAIPIALAGSLLHPVWRWITLFYTIPMVVMWLLFFTYDVRNSAAAFGPLSLGVIIGITCILAPVASALGRVGGAPRPRLFVGLAAGACIIAAAVLSAGEFRESRLRRKQEAQYPTVGMPNLTRALLQYHAEHGFEGKVVTNYQPMGFIPGLREHYVFNPIQHERHYQRTVDEARPRYTLYFGSTVPEHLIRAVSSGRVRVIQQSEGAHPRYILLEHAP
jgi:hypothetical protein